MTTAVFLEQNRARPTRASNDDVYGLVMAVAAGDPPLDEVAIELRQIAEQPRA
jgi:hypothetical protein